MRKVIVGENKMEPNPPGVMEKNNRLMMKMDKKRESNRAKSEALKRKKDKVYYPGRDKKLMKSIGNPKRDKEGLHF